MSIKSPRQKRRVHIWFYEDDWEWYKSQYEHNVGVSAAICTILHNFRENIEAKAGVSAKPVQVPEGDYPDEA